MKKYIVLTLALVLSSAPAFAAKWKRIGNPTNASVRNVYKTFSKMDGHYTGVLKVVESSEARGRSAKEVRLAEIKEAMHRYMCGFFDDGINITQSRSARAILSDLDMSSNSQDEAAVRKLEAQLEKLVSNRSLEVYSGSAGGNNTMGEVMGIYDTRNDEVTYMGFTNCGSDD